MDEIKRGALNAIGAALVAAAIWYLYQRAAANRKGEASTMEIAAGVVC